MSVFTDAEIEFVNSQRLGRLATVGADEMPHVVPVAVFYDPDADALVIGANAEFGEAVMTSSKKFRDAQRRPKAAIVIDDPGPRILEVRGDAEALLEGGEEAGRRVAAPSPSSPRGYGFDRAASSPWALTADGSRPPPARSRNRSRRLSADHNDPERPGRLSQRSRRDRHGSAAALAPDVPVPA